MKKPTHILIFSAVALGSFLFAQRPTHLNIFHQDSLGKEKVISIPVDEISDISFLAVEDTLPGDSILPDTIPVPPILPDTIPGEPSIPDTIPITPILPDTISSDTIPLWSFNFEPEPTDTIVADSDTIPQTSEIGKKRFEAI